MRPKNIFLTALVAVCALSASSLAEVKQVSPLEQLDFANGLFQRGMYKMAVAEYAKFIKDFPKAENISDAYFGRAESLFFMENYSEAIKAYGDFIGAFPSDQKAVIAGLRVGQAEFALNEYEKAISTMKALDASKLNEFFRQDLYYYLGKTYARLKNTDLALANFASSVSIQKDSEVSGYSLIEQGDIFMDRKASEKAEAYYESAYQSTKSLKVKSLALYKKGMLEFSDKDYSAAAYTFMKLMNERPDPDIALNALSNMLLALYNIGEYGDLVSEFEKNAALIPDDGAMLELYYIVVAAYEALSDFDRAQALLDRLLAAKWTTEEQKIELIKRKTNLFLVAEKYGEAVKFCEQHAKLLEKKNGPFMLFVRGEAAYGLKNYQEAAGYYGRLMSDESDRALTDAAIYGLAYCAREQGDGARAEELFLRYFNQAKDDEKRQEALYNAILIDSSDKRDADAIAHSALFLENFPTGQISEKVIFRLGGLYAAAGQHDKAVSYLGQYLNISADEKKKQEAYFLIGYSFQASGDDAGALENYLNVTAGADDRVYASALKNMALVYIKKGDNVLAAQTFRTLLDKFNPGDLDIDVYLWLTKFYIERGDFIGALDAAGKIPADKIGDRAGEVAYLKAEAFLGNKEYKKAIENYSDAIASGQEGDFRPSLYIGRGSCYIETKNYAAAGADFEKAIADYPDDNAVTVKARFGLARARELEGDKDEAYRLYMLVAILYNDDYYSPEALFSAGSIAEDSGKKSDALKAYQEIADKYKASRVYGQALERAGALNEK